MPELDAQKKQARAERFGVETKEGLAAKKQARAERFGVETKEGQEAKK